MFSPPWSQRTRDATPNAVQACTHILTTDLAALVVVKSSPYSITERGVPELIPVLGSQPAGDVRHKPNCRLSLLSARPAVTLAILNWLLPISLLGEQRYDGCEQFA